MFAKICAAVLVLATLTACASTAPKPAASAPPAVPQGPAVPAASAPPAVPQGPAVPAASAPPAVPQGPAVPATAAVPAGQLALPFDQYRPNFAEESEIQRARAMLAQACLRERGVRLDVPNDVRTPGVLDLTPNLRRYGVVDEATATQFGYHFPRTAAEARRQWEREQWSTSLSEPQRMALFGEGGCTEQADRQLTNVDDDFFVDADFQSLRTSAADPRVVAATAAWRACLAEQGYDYADPNAAISDPRWDLDAADIPTAEIDTAVADVRCKASTRFVETWHTVEVGVQQEEIRRDANRFAGLADARATRLAAARQVLAS